MDIVEELRQDREKGARRLEAEYKAGLMTLARRFCHDEGDAEELVNRTFAAVVSGIDDYLEKSAFFAWMCQIMTNIHTVDVRRLENKIILYPGDVPEVADTSSAERIYEEVDASLLREAVHKLPKESRELLVLHYFLDIPIPKIAKILAVPAGTVKSRLHYARKALAAKLGVAAQKPGGKAVILALLLSGLTALGAATWNFVVSGESQKIATEAGTSRVASRVSSSAMAEDVGHATGDARQTEASNLSTFQPFNFSTSSNLPQSSLGVAGSPQRGAEGGATSTTQGVKMNKTATTRAAAMLAAATLATGAATTANADDYIWNVPEGETETIDAVAVANIGAKDLVKTGRGKLISSDAMASYTGKITVREGAFEIKTTGDLGTDAGGTFVEDGGTLVVNMSSKDQQFGSEIFTIAGTGDAAYGAAIFQSDYHNNDQNKFFHHIALSDDATISSGTHLGLASGELTMNGHTLTITGTGTFTFRHAQTPTPVGNLVSEVRSVRFRGGANYTGDPSKTLTVRNGSTLTLGTSDDVAPPVWWNLVVEEGGKVNAEPSRRRAYNGDVAWNSTVVDGASGPLTFEGDVTGTGTIKASNATLTFSKPLGANVSLGLSGTATAALPPPNAYSYEHAGLMIGRYGKSDAWWEFNNNRVTEWKLCLEGPGPQIDQLYWTKGWWGDATGSEGEESIGGNWSLGAKGYMWNRESTNVTFHVWCRVLYKTYVAIGGSTCFVARNNTIDTDNEVTIPANSCVPFLAMTAGSGSATPGLYNSTTGLKISGGNVLRDDGKGTLFTTNAVSVLETPALPTLALADNGALDANNMAMSVAALSGMGQVANVTTLTVSNSWTLPTADAISGHSLVVDGDLAFGDNCAFSVTGMSNLELGGLYTVCTADSITGFTDTEITDGHSKCKLVKTGNRIDLVSIPNVTVLRFR
jgi:RNA polymerase sigma-70 factor (ECF subfamily)